MGEPTIKQIIPATGWDYKFTNPGSKPTRFRVAAWALYEDGSVIGLLGQTTATDVQGYPVLVPPPKVRGAMYLPTDEADEVERSS